MLICTVMDFQFPFSCFMSFENVFCLPFHLLFYEILSKLFTRLYMYARWWTGFNHANFGWMHKAFNILFNSVKKWDAILCSMDLAITAGISSTYFCYSQAMQIAFCCLKLGSVTFRPRQPRIKELCCQSIQNIVFESLFEPNISISVLRHWEVNCSFVFSWEHFKEVYAICLFILCTNVVGRFLVLQGRLSSARSDAIMV